VITPQRHHVDHRDLRGNFGACGRHRGGYVGQNGDPAAQSTEGTSMVDTVVHDAEAMPGRHGLQTQDDPGQFVGGHLQEADIDHHRTEVGNASQDVVGDVVGR